MLRDYHGRGGTGEPGKSHFRSRLRTFILKFTLRAFFTTILTAET
jgi:hypothetical protein